MKRNMKFLLPLSLLMAGACFFQACNETEYDVTGNPENLVYFNSGQQTDPLNFFTYSVDWTAIGAVGEEVVLKLPVKTTRPAEGTLTVYAEVDNALVDTYNDTYDTEYLAFPANTAKFVKASVTVAAGDMQSADSIEVMIPSENFIDLTERLYLLPVKLSAVDGGGAPSVQAGTAWMAVSLTRPGDKQTEASITDLNYMGVYKMDTENFPSVYSFTVTTDDAVQQDETVVFEKNMELVDLYNAQFGTSYVPLPENADITVEGMEVTVKVAQKESSPVTVTLNSLENLTEGTAYMMPLTMTETSVGVTPKEGFQTAYVVIDYKKAGGSGDDEYTPDDPSGKFAALDLSNPNMYANFYFDSYLQKELTNFTYQIKFKANNLSDGNIYRFFAFGGIGNDMMLRFGEGGVGNRLQICTGEAGNHFASTNFLTGQWYQLTLVYDGSKFSVYVDGELDSEIEYTGYTTIFESVELGMSWAGYRESQKFEGSIAEVRVWTRALNVSELKGGLCSVEVDSPGLLAYWKMNEGEGYIFHDATGNGYTIDWSDTWRCIEESEADPGTHLDDTHNYVQWDLSEDNVCVKE